MVLSDVSVKRPVLALVISLLLIAFGVISFQNLPVREMPDVDAPVISITTTYTGASASVVATQITQLIEDRVSGIEGIKSISSRSQFGRSDIDIEFTLSRDIDAAASDVRDAVARVVDDLPLEAEPPDVRKTDADASPIMWFNLSSTERSGLELTDYADRYLVDRLSSIDGVARVQIGGQKRYSLRIWLDRTALAARGLTVTDVEDALRSENVEISAGSIESREKDFPLRIVRAYATPVEFAGLVLRKGEGGALVRLGEVARIEIGPEEPRAELRGNREEQVGVGIVRQSKSNTLAVAEAARAEVDRIRPTLPPDMTLHDSFDSSKFIAKAIDEVYATIAIAGAIVVSVIFLFLGNLRAASIPAVTVPICLTASFIILYAFGFTINMLTLLALVLAIGIVVDDAIVVLENAQRRVDEGEPPLLAALYGTRQVGFAVIATTLVLVAVFIPIVFLQGTTGRLFAELALALCGAVVFSSLVALTLAPMMCSKILKPKMDEKGLGKIIGTFFAVLGRSYGKIVRASLRVRMVFVLALIIVAGGGVFIFRELPAELAPQEDQGAFFVVLRGPEGAGFEYTQRQMRKVEEMLMPLVESGEAIRVLARIPGSFGSSGDFSTGRFIIVLDDWDKRRSAEEIMEEVRTKTASVPGVRVSVVMRQLVGRGGGDRPAQLVLSGGDYPQLMEWRDVMLDKLREDPRFERADSDLKETKPQFIIEVDRQRADDLGVSISTIGRTLETVFASKKVTTYLDRGEEYDVILQGERADREDPNDIANLFVRSDRSGELVPLSNVVRLSELAEPPSLNRYDRLPAVTIDAGLTEGFFLGEALDEMERIVREDLPPRVIIDYKGQSAEFKEATGSGYFVFGLALVVVYLVLAAQFESLIHPLIIMTTVPLAISGALFGLYIAGNSINIYSQVGILMLIGLAAKNGILIVEFANQLRDEGREFEDALVEACEIRLRPILMTGISTAIGALPLILATGAGSASRMTIGIVIFSGVLFATFVTLFVVPVFYHLFARGTASPSHVAQEIEALERSRGVPGAAE